jgi:hypothetical protein
MQESSNLQLVNYMNVLGSRIFPPKEFTVTFSALHISFTFFLITGVGLSVLRPLLAYYTSPG